MEEMTRQEGGLIAIISHSQVLIAVLPRRPSPFSSLPLSLFFSLHYPSLILLIVMTSPISLIVLATSSCSLIAHALFLSPHRRGVITQVP
ncbi:BnaA02g21760D [Brassica napus]|uniref:BnaA02g21760D protein n=1 Tax=Brassica napus TaxID=3708 RepID=A0A078GFM8_BRANA|nr:BnaA02g21760D [Brassica napus]